MLRYLNVLKIEHWVAPSHGMMIVSVIKVDKV